jgi:hypothetical protein
VLAKCRMQKPRCEELARYMQNCIKVRTQPQCHDPAHSSSWSCLPWAAACAAVHAACWLLYRCVRRFQLCTGGKDALRLAA